MLTRPKKRVGARMDVAKVDVVCLAWQRRDDHAVVPTLGEQAVGHTKCWPQLNEEAEHTAV